MPAKAASPPHPSSRTFSPAAGCEPIHLCSKPKEKGSIDAVHDLVTRRMVHLAGRRRTDGPVHHPTEGRAMSQEQVQQLLAAIRGGDRAAVDQLLTADATLVRATAPNGVSAVLWAAY